MSEIEILNAMAERAVDHWVSGELYKIESRYVQREQGGLWDTEVVNGNCLLGLVGYGVWGEAYNRYCQEKVSEGSLKMFLKLHRLSAGCLEDGYDILECDPDAQAVIHRLAELIRGMGTVVDDQGHEWEPFEGTDLEVVYTYNDSLGKEHVTALIDKARADAGAVSTEVS